MAKSTIRKGGPRRRSLGRIAAALSLFPITLSLLAWYKQYIDRPPPIADRPAAAIVQEQPLPELGASSDKKHIPDPTIAQLGGERRKPLVEPEAEDDDSPAKPIKRASRSNEAAPSSAVIGVEEEIAGIIREHESALQACYESGLKRERRLRGRGELTFDIGASGRVRKVDFRAGKIMSAEIGACVLNRAREWRFPRHPNGAVSIVYPVIFTQY